MTESEALHRSAGDPELERIVAEEQSCLARVLEHLKMRRPSERPTVDYDEQMISLRDQISTARLEDVPPLVEQMERLQMLAARKREVAEGWVDVRSPYFGHLVLQEGGRRREVLIGRTTYIDAQSGVRIVDWRDAPVSRIYYRYDEGAEYEEIFADREVRGEVITRRSVTVVDGLLRRIGTPAATFVRGPNGDWRRLDQSSARLTGGQGSAVRAERYERPRRLGSGEELVDDKHLKEITPLIDPRQFELLTRPDSGLVVIQGGAGSGKTTIGLHRLAYLAYNDARRFRPDRMLIVVFNEALARYVAQVLPALGVEGVPIRTYENWTERLRDANFPRIPGEYAEETPGVVTRLKKHPVMLRAIDARVSALESRAELAIERASSAEQDRFVAKAWRSSSGRPFAHRLHAVSTLLAERGRALSTDARVALERSIQEGMKAAKDVVGAWAELFGDRVALGRLLEQYAPGEFSAAELNRAHTWCAARAAEVLLETEERADTDLGHAPVRRSRDSRRQRGRHELGPAGESFRESEDSYQGIDGREVEERARLDREDDTLLLRLAQLMLGSLKRPGKAKEPLVYEHVLVDEAQDLSPVELAVVINTVSKAQSLTLAGDVAQRLLLDNGFTDWKTVLSELGLSHVEIEPLRLTYRSTREIMEFARGVLGPLAPAEPLEAPRSGAPVELFSFAHSGEAVGFLGETLRELMQSEPRGSVAVVARYPEQADAYYEGLVKAEVPNVRRIADQDFPFRPGIDVTDVRQVKGLEFDYVVLVEVTEAAYPIEDEARHLLHIGATRAAHQLWLLTTGRPSSLLPEELRNRGY